ncbi:hypothetical protein HQ489_02170 [Candidatus Woesearchaeota archaeon]|nr:hypothetical protein [Candidatus Woesearchaeota archaeon]
MNIEFRVEGKPPKKDGSQSLWSERSNQALLVFNLREKAFEAKQTAKIEGSFSGLVKIKISIFAPFITINDQHQHVGDLDNLVAGIFESIQPASNNETLTPNKIFDQNPDVAPHIALLIDDDSQVVSLSAEKIKSNLNYYVVEIESIEGL